MADETPTTTTTAAPTEAKAPARPDFQSMMAAVNLALQGTEGAPAEKPPEQPMAKEDPKQESPAKETKPEKPAAEAKPKESTPEPKLSQEPKPDEKPQETTKDRKGKFVVQDGIEEKEPPIELLRRAYKDSKAAVEKLTAELETLKKQPQTVANIEEITALKRERDEALNILKLSDRQRHPEFKKQFVEPLENTVKKASAYVPSESRSKLEQILRLPQSPERMDAIESVIGDLPHSRQVEILRLAGVASDIVTAREEAISESSGWWDAQQRREATAARERYMQEKEAWESEVNEVGRDAAADVELFRFKEGDEEHNTSVRKRLDEVKQLVFGDGSKRRMIEAAFLAVVGKETFPMLSRARKEISDRDESIAKLQNELEELRSKRPNLGKSAAPSADGKPKSAIEAALAALQGNG